MPTKREQLQRKLKKLFANRSDELALFRRFITGVDDFGLLHVMGIAGIGKTALLDAFSVICTDEQIPWVLANVGDQELPASLIRFIGSQLTRTSRLALPKLEAELARYDAVAQKVRTDKRIPRAALNLLLTGMADPTKSSRKDSEQGAEQALGFLSKVLGGDADFYLNPISQFTTALLADFEELPSGLRICLMFDRYERITPSLDSWIRNELFSNLGDNIQVVTSGRQELPEEWQEWRPITRVQDLKSLTVEDTKALVRARGITNEKAVQKIAQFADGLPLAASIAADVLRQSGAIQLEFEGVAGYLAIVGRLVKKLTEEAPADLRGWLEQCAIVRWFNEDTLEQFVGIPRAEVREAYARLGQLSFVQSHPDGLALHDLVREFISDDLARRSERRYTELHREAAMFYERRMTEASHRAAQPSAVEMVYHLLRAGESEGFVRLRVLFDNATDFSQVEFSSALLETTQGLDLHHDNQLWLEHFRGVLWQQKNTDNLKSAQILEALVSDPEIEKYPELKARTAAYLSVASWYIAEFQSALRYAEMGLELSRSSDLSKFRNRSLEVLGLIYNRLGRHIEAIETQLELLELTRQSHDQMGEAWALNNLGYFSWHAGRWTQAERFLLECRDLLAELSSPYNVVYPLCHIGLLYTAVDRMNDAETNLLESLEICEQEGNLEIKCKTLQNLTYLRYVQNRLEDALDHINLALDISHSMVHPYYDTDCLRLRGLVFGAMGRIEDAVADFRVGLELAQRLGAKFLEVSILASLMTLRLHEGSGQYPEEERIVEISHQINSYHVLSDLRFSQAAALLQDGKGAEAKQHFLEALVNGLLYNRYWLYNQLTKIDKLTREWQSTGRGEQAYDLLKALADLWDTEAYNGKSLKALEEVARVNEPGLAPLPPPLIIQLRTVAESLRK